MADLENGPHWSDVGLDEPDKFYLRVEGTFNKRAEAEEARNAAEDAMSKFGELIDSAVWPEPSDEHSVRAEPTDEEQTRRGPYIPDARQENDPTL